MSVPYTTKNLLDQAVNTLEKEIEEIESKTSDCVAKNHQDFPYSSTVGGSDSPFPGMNFVLKGLYAREGSSDTETIVPVVMGNSSGTVDKSYHHSIPIRDVDGRLYSYCYTAGGGKSYDADTEYMLTNVGCVKTIIAKKVPDIASTADDGTYVLKATKSGTTITYNWVKES